MAGASPPPPSKKRGRDEEEESEDAVLAALGRLAPHFSNAAKAARAASLLTRLLTESSDLRPAHSTAVLGALCAAAGDAPTAWAPGKTPESVAAARSAASLTQAVGGVAGKLWPPGGQEGEAAAAAVLEVLELWSSARADLTTDDSFALSAAVRRLTAAVEALPPLEGADGGPAADAVEASALAALAAAPGRAKDAVTAGCVAWTPAQAAAAKRSALLDAFAYLTSPPSYGRAWARATIDAAVTGALTRALERRAFNPAQAERVAALQRVVSAARAARGAGRRPEGGGGGGGGNAFEAERARWAGAAVSSRGSLGAGRAGGHQVLGGG